MGGMGTCEFGCQWDGQQFYQGGHRGCATNKSYYTVAESITFDSNVVISLNNYDITTTIRGEDAFDVHDSKTLGSQCQW